jgi:hypothetical protein
MAFWMHNFLNYHGYDGYEFLLIYTSNDTDDIDVEFKGKKIMKWIIVVHYDLTSCVCMHGKCRRKRKWWRRWSYFSN